MRGKKTRRFNESEHDEIRRLKDEIRRLKDENMRLKAENSKLKVDNKVFSVALQNSYQCGMLSTNWISDGELAKRFGIPKRVLKEKLKEMSVIVCINGEWKSTSVYVQITPKGTSIKLDTPIRMILGKEYNRVLLEGQVLAYCTLLNSDINNIPLLEEVNK